MNIEEFKKNAYATIDWIADYYKNIEKYPVKSQVEPYEIFKKLPNQPPEMGEDYDSIMKDFNNIILPGITHWEHPSFFAYFPANNSFPSILAEMLTSSLGSQCMSWETSPAAAELEEKVMNWLKIMIGLPATFDGVIQDTASTATLCAILSAREKYSNFNINIDGFSKEKFRVYCSKEAHSSIEKAVKISGIGKKNLVKIDVDNNFAMRTDLLKESIETDIKNGYKPLCVVSAIGTTGSGAVDPLKEISEICKNYNIWLHVDSAYAGSALILEEYKYLLEGIENCDSFVFNPHKWLFTNFDCSAYFVKDKKTLLNTFEILPEYLKTASDSKVNNYRDWGIQLGRRFRALKLWFVIRSFGVQKLKEKLRDHIKYANNLAKKIQANENFELLAPVSFSLICFRYRPKGISNPEKLNLLNSQLLQNLNRTGKIYLTHTKLNSNYTLRFVIAQTNVEERHVEKAWELIQEIAGKI